jgi:hypothetical protein
LSALVRGPALSVAAMALLLGSMALADGTPRVVLVGPSEKDATVARIRQELQILGIEVEFVAAGARHGDLAATAREHGASAAAEVQRRPAAVVIWTDPERFPDAGTGPELRVDEGLAGTAEPGLLALRAVELLRGRILPVPSPASSAQVAGADQATPEADAALKMTAPPPPAGTSSARAAPAPRPDAPRPAPAGAPPDRARGPSGFVGPALFVSPGGVAATPQVWLGARWAPVSRIDLELIGFAPTTAATVSALEGAVDLRVGALGAGASVRLIEPTADVFASAGLGVGVLLSLFAGETRGPWRAAQGSRWTALPYARAAAGYWLAQHVAIRGDAMLGAALPRPVIRIAGRKIASYGEPAILLAVGLEVRP